MRWVQARLGEGDVVLVTQSLQYPFPHRMVCKRSWGQGREEFNNACVCCSAQFERAMRRIRWAGEAVGAQVLDSSSDAFKARTLALREGYIVCQNPTHCECHVCTAVRRYCQVAAQLMETVGGGKGEDAAISCESRS